MGVPGTRAEEKRYLREVERHFLRRRGSPLLISPRDWALALAWFEEGIPLSVVFAGIDEVFDRADGASSPSRRPRSLAYCARAIEGIWHERRSRAIQEVGEGTRRSEERSRLAECLEAAAARLRLVAASFEPAASGGLMACADSLATCSAELRSPRGRPAEMDSEIARTDAEIGRLLVAGCLPEERERAAREAEERLAPHRPHMTGAAWRRTLERAVENRLRERHDLPRLSLLLIR